MNPLDRITQRVNRHGPVDDPVTPRPLLTISEFFDGNDVVGSIGCNLSPAPTPAEFRGVLETIAGRQDVADVRVQVSMFDDPEWPFSDTVWVITSAAPEAVATWFPDALQPDDVSVGWPSDDPVEPCAVPSGMQPLACWWD
jgi:hypothetical protein